MSWAGYLERPLMRGAALWGLVLLAVMVRELARALGAAWFSIDVKSMMLLPTGAILTYATPEAVALAREPRIQRWMASIGPVSNLLFGATMAALILTVAPSVDLVSRHWVTPLHLLRALVWVNLLLAAVNFLPAWPLDAARVMQGELQRGSVARNSSAEANLDGDGTDGERTGRGSAGRGSAGRGALGQARVLTSIGPAIALSFIVLGVLLANFWVVMAGMAILLGAQLERQGVAFEATGSEVCVRDVMLTEYSILSASATLEDAVEQARHTLQDVFPVVRAGNMVGAVARRDVVNALSATGNGYVQGIMTRTFETAAPGDALLATLARVMGQVGASSQLVPVIEGERIVGIITPQNLQRTIRMVGRSAAQERGRGRNSKSEDEMD